ncbi:MAG: nucleotidyltransferase substrate binding protein [Rickettsiales bacterium]|nr:MAG: nucleotidyltransferase substrate binding protein [Rickettsiales bacterium]
MINTEFLNKSIETLEKSYQLLQKADKDSIDYEMYRNSLVKSFEMVIEQTGKLLRKRLLPYFSTKREVDNLIYKDLFKNASKFSLITQEETERWFKYRDNRNETAHDYGEQFANDTLSLIDDFLIDAKKIEEVIKNG